MVLENPLGKLAKSINAKYDAKFKLLEEKILRLEEKNKELETKVKELEANIKKYDIDPSIDLLKFE